VHFFYFFLFLIHSICPSPRAACWAYFYTRYSGVILSESRYSGVILSE
jgi:hypothetical protein